MKTPKPKPIIAVDKKGRVRVADIRKSPTQHERIAFAHRTAESAFRRIRRATPKA